MNVAFRYPIYAVQWHPERSPYEWKLTKEIPHSSEAIKVSWYLADFFVNEGMLGLFPVFGYFFF